jgi:hypothetical protein
MWMKYTCLTLVVILCGTPSFAQSLKVDSAEVDVVRDQLLLYGDFGNVTGRVAVDSVDMQVIRWMPYWIRIQLPRAGRGSAGDITVSNGFKSVTSAKLSSWIVSISGRHIIGDGRNNWSVSGSGYSGYGCTFRGLLIPGRALKMTASQTASFYESSQFTHFLSYGQNSEYKKDGESHDASFKWGDTLASSGMSAVMTLDKDGAAYLNITVRGKYPSVRYSEELKDGKFTSTRDTTWSSPGGTSRSFSSDTSWQVKSEHSTTSPCSWSTYRSECVSDFSVSVSFPPAPRNSQTASINEDRDSVLPVLKIEVYDLLGNLVWKGAEGDGIPSLSRGHYFIRTTTGRSVKTTRILQR